MLVEFSFLISSLLFFFDMSGPLFHLLLGDSLSFRSALFHGSSHTFVMEHLAAAGGSTKPKRRRKGTAYGSHLALIRSKD